MALDTRFIPISTIPQFILDKLTAIAMGGGTFEFYHDNSQSTPKVVYQLVSNSPGIYSYVSVGSLLTLNVAGTFVDGNGSEFIPYLFPYDGDASTTTNTLDLYYIVAKNSAGVQQFTLHGVPNLAPSSGGSSNPILVNHIANGQFQLHNEHVPVSNSNPTFDYGSPRNVVTETQVAPGGIIFERSSLSAATDTITFTRNSQYDANDSGSPRYLVNINRSAPSADNVVGLVFRFMDVNKFTNPDTTANAPTLTFVFNAVSLAGSASNININKIKYYGTGGSTTTVTNLSSNITITTANQQFAVSFTNSPDVSAIAGSLNNDFVEFEISFASSSSTFNVSITDVMLLNGTYTVTPGQSSSILFPQTTNGQFLLEAGSNIAPSTQSPFTTQYYPQDGSNLYLPMIMTQSGWTYDYSQIGKIVTKFTATNTAYNELLCDGTQYLTSDYSALGIPYSRLQQVLFNTTLNGPIFGTGANWVNVYLNSGTAGQILLSNNKLGNVADPADSGGGTATGWTFVSASANAGSAGFGYIAHANSTNNNVTAISTFNGNVSGLASAGTSGMTIANYDQGITGTKYAFVVSAISAAALAGGATGLYFDFSNNGVNYRMWFHTVAEAAPAAGGRTLIQCNLVATMPASVVAVVIANVLSGFKNFPITITGQPANAGGSYWTFVSNAVTTNVWYKVAGVGTAPAGTSNVQVTLTGTETAAQIATLTQTAINSQYFAVPDLRGLFLRGLDNSVSPQWDLDIASRTGLLDTITTTLPGTLEFQQVQTHSHGISTFNAGNNAATVGQGNGANADSATTVTQGGSETRPVNMAVNYFIKY